MDELTIKHLELVQSVINRMSINSFVLKGWTVTVASALLALIVSNSQPLFGTIVLFTVLSFWGLDAYYLRQERLFRRLYDDVRRGGLSETSIVPPFSLSTAPYRPLVYSWFRTLWTRSVVGLHGVVVIGVILALIVLFWGL
jgi:hypothetical protein